MMSTKFAKAIFLVLTARQKLLGDVIALISSDLAEPDFVGKWHIFDHTDYYTLEMGSPLYRCLVSTNAILEWHEVAILKDLSMKWEDALKKNGKRTVNIDPGLVDYHKFVLLSRKDGGYRIPVSKGIWADISLWYDKEWKHLPWSFPDIRTGVYNRDLQRCRSLFKLKMKTGSPASKQE